MTIDSSGTDSFTVTAKEDDGNTTDQKVTFGFGGLPGNIKLGAMATRTAAVTVRDTTRPILSFGAAAYTAIENGDAAIVEITLSPKSDQTVTVPIATAPATGDFLLSAREVVFAPGEQRKTITVAAAKEDASNADTTADSVTLTFPDYSPANPVVTTAGGQASTIVTLADDGQRVVTIAAAEMGNIAEGATLDVTVTMAPVPTAEVKIPITVSPASGRQLCHYRSRKL